MRNDFDAVIKQMVKIRRDIHQHPEVGFQEKRTQKLIFSELQSFGCKNIRIMAKTGIVIDIQGEGAENNIKRTIAFRADIDALPITEQGERNHKSQK